jgi:DedD protein
MPCLALSVSPPFWVVTVKERLTGAIILVALIVLLVPELLTGPVRSAPKSAGLGSSAEEAPLRSYTINLAEDAHAHAVPLGSSGPAPPAPLTGAGTAATEAPAPTPADSVPPPAASAPSLPPAHSAAPAPAPAPSHATPAATRLAQAPVTGGWVVQLGSFSSESNAQRLAQRVRAQGFAVSVSQSGSGRHLYRVRVGPVREHSAALQLAQKLSADGHSGAVEPR